MEKLDVNVNKYYTPTIDEFYVGFEYERFVPISNAIEEECWDKLAMSVNYLSLDEIDNEIIEKEVKVRYLDKTDIESLGFIQRDTVAIQHLFGPINLKSDEEQIIYTKPIPEFGGLTAYLHFYTNRSTYGTVLSIHKDLTNPYNQKQLFYGTIKNKSELVKLLKMLGINE